MMLHRRTGSTSADMTILWHRKDSHCRDNASTSKS